MIFRLISERLFRLFGLTFHRTLQSAYPETEIHPVVCLVKIENGQRHWREREDPPVQTICMNAASKVGSGSDRPESRSWPICHAMTAPALVLLS